MVGGCFGGNGLHHPACGDVPTREILVVQPVEANAVCARRGVDEFAVAGVDADVRHVAARTEEDKIAGSEVAARDGFADARLIVGVARELHTNGAIHRVRQSRAVDAVRRRAAGAIGSAEYCCACSTTSLPRASGVATESLERGYGNSCTTSVVGGTCVAGATDGSTGDGWPVKRGALEHAESVAAQIASRASLVAEYRESTRRMNLRRGKERALHTP